MWQRCRVDADKVSVLRELLAGDAWIQRTDEFAGAMRGVTRRADGLLLVGTPDYEPWHLAAHLDDEATFGGAVDLRPTLVRWAVPERAAPHLSVGMDRLTAIRRGEPLLVVSEAPSEPLLDRVDLARRRGGTIFTLGSMDDDLVGLSHETLPISDLTPAAVNLDLAEHLVSLSAAKQSGRPIGWRGSLRRALDRLCGS